MPLVPAPLALRPVFPHLPKLQEGGVPVTYHYGLQWCSRPGCPCGRAGKPCSSWEGWPKRFRRYYNQKDKDTWPNRWGPCCGWEKSDHRSLIHKGGRP